MNENIKKFDSILIASFFLLVALDAFVWFEIVFAKPPSEPRMYFLDVGQGDAELAVLSGGATILTDAGPDKTILREMEKIPALGNHYIILISELFPIPSSTISTDSSIFSTNIGSARSF